VISAFTFCHNSLKGGYPVAEAIAAVRPHVDEVVAVDMASDDGTRELLEDRADLVLDSCWDCGGVKPMNQAFLLHVRCRYDTILLFEADEVWDPRLARTVRGMARGGPLDLRVWRLQVSQNGQRLRWGPHPVHRVFQKGMGTYLDNPVIAPEQIPVLPPEHGYVWDVTAWFRDNYYERRAAHGQCFGPQRNVMAREHFLQPPEMDDTAMNELLAGRHWEAKASPFALPDVLKPLVGMTRYEVTV